MLMLGAGCRIRTYEGIKPADLQSAAFGRFANPAKHHNSLTDVNQTANNYAMLS